MKSNLSTSRLLSSKPKDKIKIEAVVIIKRNTALMINPKNCFFRIKNTKKVTVKLILMGGGKQRGRDRERTIS